MKDVICGYDGFKLFIPGVQPISHLIKNSEEFNLYGRYSVHKKEQYSLPLKGEYLVGEHKGQKYYLKVNATKYNGLNEGVEIKGSFHKLYTGGENYSKYYWLQFIETITKLCKIFGVPPSSIHIINLELGFNLTIPAYWRTSAKDIIRNILTYKGGTFKERTDIDHKDDGYYLQFSLHQYLLKLYDKAMQNGLKHESIFRYEIKVLKSAYLKSLAIVTLEDLLCYNKHQALANELGNLFSNFIVYQEEIYQGDFVPKEYENQWAFCKGYAWEELHAKDRHSYKNMKKRLEAVAERYCFINYKKELQLLITAAINSGSNFHL
jgi:hypothetical protein